MIRIELVHKDAVIVIEEESTSRLTEAVKEAIKAVDYAGNDLTGFQGDSTPPPGDDPRLAAYQCEKIVHAAKITAIEPFNKNTGTCRLHLKNDGEQWSIRTRSGWLDRCEAKPDSQDLGYYVEYEDGFTSWSPTEEFERGYRRIV